MGIEESDPEAIRMGAAYSTLTAVRQEEALRLAATIDPDRDQFVQAPRVAPAAADPLAALREYVAFTVDEANTKSTSEWMNGNRSGRESAAKWMLAIAERTIGPLLKRWPSGVTHADVLELVAENARLSGADATARTEAVAAINMLSKAWQEEREAREADRAALRALVEALASPTGQLLVAGRGGGKTTLSNALEAARARLEVGPR